VALQDALNRITQSRSSIVRGPAADLREAVIADIAARGHANEPPAVPVACPTGRGIAGIRGHSRQSGMFADLGGTSSAAL
jgi:hypothetical protein